MNGRVAVNLDTFPYATKYILMDGSSLAVIMAKIGKVLLYVDVNGFNPPNVRGKDIFEFAIGDDTNHLVMPNGYGKTRDEITNICNKDEYWCAALIMLDNWQIKYDF